MEKLTNKYLLDEQAWSNEKKTWCELWKFTKSVKHEGEIDFDEFYEDGKDLFQVIEKQDIAQ